MNSKPLEVLCTSGVSREADMTRGLLFFALWTPAGIRGGDQRSRRAHRNSSIFVEDASRPCPGESIIVSPNPIETIADASAPTLRPASAVGHQLLALQEQLRHT